MENIITKIIYFEKKINLFQIKRVLVKLLICNARSSVTIIIVNPWLVY